MSQAESWAKGELETLRANALLRALDPLESAQGPIVQVAGERLINFSSNDYLGLAAHPGLVSAAHQAGLTFGFGAGASRLVVGDSVLHQRLEEALARFEHTEAARLFNSGYTANLALIPTLVGPSDAVFSDALNHASLIDGCRASRAQVMVYPHVDVAALEEALSRSRARRKLVVTDGVFSMDGDVAPLSDLVAVCERHAAAILVDEAHGTGVLGKRGAGACEAAEVEARVDLRMGTLSKALGGFGAYAATSGPVAELLLSRSRPLIFSTALPPSLCAAALESLRIVEEEPERRARLWRHIRRFTEGLLAQGRSAEARSAIFPIVIGAPDQALAAAARLRARGLLVKAIRPPTVPEGTSRLRFALSAAHTDDQVEQALDALATL